LKKTEFLPRSARRINFPGRTQFEYFAGEDGNIYVKKFCKRKKRFMYNTLKPIKPTQARNNFRVKIYFKNGEVRFFFVHLLIATAFWGKCMKGWEVTHRNGDTSDNSKRNLCYRLSGKVHSFYDILTEEEWSEYQKKLNSFTMVYDMKKFNENGIQKVRQQSHKLGDKNFRKKFFKKLFEIKEGK